MHCRCPVKSDGTHTVETCKLFLAPLIPVYSVIVERSLYLLDDMVLGLSKTMSPAQGEGTYKITIMIHHKKPEKMNENNKA